MYLSLVQGSDLAELRRHSYSNSVDPYTIKQLVRKVFPRCRCKEVKLQTAAVQPEPPKEALECAADIEPSLTTSPSSTTSRVGGGAPLPLHDRTRWCAGHEVAVPIEATVQSLDAREECVSTLLCYLELQGWVEVLIPVQDVCALKCYGGPRQLRALAQKVPAVAAAAARLREKGEASTLSIHARNKCTGQK